MSPRVANYRMLFSGDVAGGAPNRQAGADEDLVKPRGRVVWIANCMFEARGSRSTRKGVATAPPAAGFNQKMLKHVDREDLSTRTHSVNTVNPVVRHCSWRFHRRVQNCGNGHLNHGVHGVHGVFALKAPIGRQPSTFLVDLGRSIGANPNETFVTLVTFVFQNCRFRSSGRGVWIAHCIFEPRGSRSTRKLAATAPIQAAGPTIRKVEPCRPRQALDAITP